MCANYEVKESDFEAFAELKLDPRFPPFKPSLFPGYDVPVFRADGPCLLRWGLVPSWSKTERAEFSTFNARSENVQKSPVFRGPFAKRRCLMPASSFFEWTKTKPKTRYRFIVDEAKPFLIAGIWDRWERDETFVESVSMLTTMANETVGRIHDRMPVILQPSDYAWWLDPEAKSDNLLGLLVPFAGGMTGTLAPKT